MNNVIQLSSVRSVAPSNGARALEALTSRLAREHDQHETPIVPCYLCLHGVPRQADVLAKAA